MKADKTIKMENYHPPYTLGIKAASKHFGIAEQTFYNKISSGELRPFIHYLKYGKKVLIIREGFIRYLFERSGGGHHFCSGG